MARGGLTIPPLSRSTRIVAGSGTLALLTGVLLTGCSGTSPTQPAGDPTAFVPPGRSGPEPIRVSSDPWVLSTDRWDEKEFRGAYLGNGLLGQTFDRTGIGFPVRPEGPALAAGHYNRDDSLEKVPPPFPLAIVCGGETFGQSGSRTRSYRQELRLREGLLATRTTWDAGGGGVELEIETCLDRSRPNRAVLVIRVKNGAREPVRLELREDGFGRPSGSRLQSHTTEGLERTAELLGESGAPASFEVAPGGEGRFRVESRYRGPMFPEVKPEKPAPAADAILQVHKRAWARLWRSDIEIEGDPEAQQVVRSCLFYLLCSVRPENRFGVPPMGLSSQAFSGHVFWDMDSWIFPALLPQHPDLARAMLDYRARTLSGARQNAAAEKLPGAALAWESGRTGKEALRSSVYSKGRHVSGDLALAIGQYARATGDSAWLRGHGWELLRATADNWAARARPRGSGFEISGITTPDENAGEVQYSAWTQFVARRNLELAAETARRLGKPIDPKWTRVAAGLGFRRLPGSGVIQSHDRFTDKSKSKQADALLLVHPGEMEMKEGDLKALYDFYSARVIPSGPAMTESIHAIAAARLGNDVEAMRHFRESYRPFVRSPYMTFSEKRSRDNLCFLTGAAGVIESVLYGFGGLQLTSASPDRPLIRQPRVPEEWKSLRLRNLQWNGRKWDLELRRDEPPRWQTATAQGDG